MADLCVHRRNGFTARTVFFPRVQRLPEPDFSGGGGHRADGAALYGHLSRRLFYRLEIHPAFDDGNGICQLRQFFK